MTLFEMLVEALSPREASAKVNDIMASPNEEYLPRQYRRIVEAAGSAPETVTALPSQKVLQKIGASAAYDPTDQRILYNKDVTNRPKNLQNPLVHEDELRGFMPERGNMKDLETFEGRTR